MCDPLTIGGIALSAGSMIANNVAQGQVASARKGAMTAERIRQDGLQKEANALNDQSRDRYSDFQADQQQKVQQLSDYFKGQNQAVPQQANTPTETIPTASSNIVVQEQAKQSGKAKQYGDQQASALGNLRGFGDLLADKTRLQARDASQVGTIGGFMKGSNAVLPLELDAANNKGAGMRMFGDILGGLGSIGTAAGIAKGNYNLFGLGKAGAAANVANTADTVMKPATAGAFNAFGLY